MNRVLSAEPAILLHFKTVGVVLLVFHRVVVSSVSYTHLVLGALLVGSVEAILPYALAFAAGAMILVAVHELIPECQRNREARPYTATMGIVAGFAIMMLLDVALG